MSRNAKLPPLEAGLLTAMHSLDNQILRAMQRDPDELDKQGVQKWEPYSQKANQIASFTLEAFANRRIELDSILVLAQAFSSVVERVVHELGEDGLGNLRTLYVLSALNNITSSMHEAQLKLQGVTDDQIM